MNTTKFVACIGARETSKPILDWMEETGAKLVRAGYTIVSGNAPGSDQAWARGGNAQDARQVVLCLPWDDFEASAIHPLNTVRVVTLQYAKYAQVVVDTHPNISSLSAAAMRLHARNAMIVEGAVCVLGALNDDKPNGGGTRNAFRIAQGWKIPTFNVADALIRAEIDKRLAAGGDVQGRVWNTGKGKKW